MTDKARIVLQDCQNAVASHSLDLQGEELRVSWVAILTLLRAVGHVLDKVDGKSSPAMAQAVAKWWKATNASKPEPAIFWQFIDDARNRVVKLYEHGIWRQLVLEGPLHQGMPTTILVDQANAQGGKIITEDGHVISELSDGAFAGRSERDVAFEACRWWHGVLGGLDARARELAK
jgi:hypothetical protein